jgi:transcriptional regulator with PAS, ATPase and Fis domain
LEIFDLAGRAVFLRRFPGFGGEDGRTAYLIGAQAQVVAALSDFNDVYRRLEREGTDVRGADRLATRFRLWGNDAVVEKTRYLLDKICDKNVAVLLTGESGTGKTFLAKEIHNNSRRSSAPFINVNCAAIPYNLLESELFGYEEGAFTGARKQGKAGHFEMADGGTLFLDEITEIPITLQGKLLEVIQDNSFYRVGGTKKITVNVRLIMATNKDVGRLVEEGRFRNDLYYRINVFPIALPPLRERITSFYTILMDILPDICSRLEMGPLLLSDDSVQKLKSYSWPGNIRELENVLEKAAILSDGTMIRAEDIVLQRRNGATAFDLKSRVDAAERQMIVNALRIFEGNRILTARHLNIGRTSLFDKMKKYRIDDSEIGGFHGDIE